MKRVNPGVTQFQLLPHGVPPAAACCLRVPGHPQTGSERALTPFFHPLHWQRGKRPDNRVITCSCRPGHGSPSVRRTNSLLQQLPLPRSTRPRPLVNGSSLLTCPGAQACCSSSASTSLPPCSPEAESQGDRPVAEVSRTAAEAFPFRQEQRSSTSYLSAYSHTAQAPCACSLQTQPSSYRRRAVLGPEPPAWETKINTPLSFVKTQTCER